VALPCGGGWGRLQLRENAVSCGDVDVDILLAVYLVGGCHAPWMCGGCWGRLQLRTHPMSCGKHMLLGSWLGGCCFSAALMKCQRSPFCCLQLCESVVNAAVIDASNSVVRWLAGPSGFRIIISQLCTNRNEQEGDGTQTGWHAGDMIKPAYLDRQCRRFLVYRNVGLCMQLSSMRQMLP
jgi:hypothetical protein